MIPVPNARAIVELNLARLKHEIDCRDGWVDSQNRLCVVALTDQRQEIVQFLCKDIGIDGWVFEDNPELEFTPPDGEDSIPHFVLRLEQGYGRAVKRTIPQAIRVGDFWLLFRVNRDDFYPVSLRPDNPNPDVDWIISLSRAWWERKFGTCTFGRLTIELEGQSVRIQPSWSDDRIRKCFDNPRQADQSNFPEIARALGEAFGQVGAVFANWQPDQPLADVVPVNKGKGFRMIRNGWKFEATPEETNFAKESPSD